MGDSNGVIYGYAQGVKSIPSHIRTLLTSPPSGRTAVRAAASSLSR
jgi:hypothetical protein